MWPVSRCGCLQGGYQVFLDHRVLRTPARQPVVLPTLSLATAVAAEWEMQARAGVLWGLHGNSLRKKSLG